MLAGSGMADGGRIMNHLITALENKKNSDKQKEPTIRLKDLIMIKFKQPPTPKKGLERYREIMKNRERNSIIINSLKIEDEWND